MKKYILIAIVLLTSISCEQFKQVAEIEEVTPISANVKISAAGISADTPLPSSYTVRFINYGENFEISKTTDASGNVSTSDLIPGVYTVTATGESAGGGFTYYFSGSLTNINILTGGQNFNIEVASSKAGALILKEIYFNGSTGYYFKDQFYEIYNNSEEVQYADGMGIGNILPTQASTATYNWEVPDGKPENYIYLASIWQVPGDGNDFPVKPGESIVIAQIAQNHTAIKPTSPVDLSGAEFETFIVNQSVNPDNPNAHNMILAFDKGVFGTQWLVTVFGGAYAIFMPDKEIDPNGWVKPQGKSDQAYPIPIDCVLDAVEIVNNATKINQKRMPTNLDAGATFTGATYNCNSVSRKIRETKADGRHIYMDTNNSSDDFQLNSVAMVRRNNPGVPSWNTWYKK
jgi:hypothetical protein